MSETPSSRRRARSLAVLVALPLVAGGALAPQPVDLTGRWSVQVGTPGDPQPRTLDLVMARDGALTGSVARPEYGTAAITTGRVDGAHFTFTAVLGTGLPLSYEGTVVRDTIRGTWRYERDGGPFVGVRGDVAPAPVAGQGTRKP